MYICLIFGNRREHILNSHSSWKQIICKSRFVLDTRNCMFQELILASIILQRQCVIGARACDLSAAHILWRYNVQFPTNANQRTNEWMNGWIKLKGIKGMGNKDTLLLIASICVCANKQTRMENGKNRHKIATKSHIQIRTLLTHKYTQNKWMGYLYWGFYCSRTATLYHNYYSTDTIQLRPLLQLCDSTKTLGQEMKTTVENVNTHAHNEKRVKSLENAKMKRKLRYRRYYIKIPYEFASFIL